ncbi:hypothetical protein [Streptomyces sp. ATCC 21386]|uniref:hypothetical protein n=1 Tax=Streptomyces sp. ATCC 21386 TaxID=2699428 RepID=UPI001BFFB1A9|nr:hypothetical protein [Streptomyces sp. ATCC 21386]
MPRNAEAMLRICSWLDRLRVSDDHSTRQPRWITRITTVPPHLAVLSWCYGTPGYGVGKMDSSSAFSR